MIEPPAGDGEPVDAEPAETEPTETEPAAQATDETDESQRIYH